MTNIADSEPWLNWKVPLFFAAGAAVVQASLMVYSAYGDFLYTLLLAPIVCLVLFVTLIIAAIRKRRHQCVSLVLTMISFLAVSGVLGMNRTALRDSLRWQLWSHRFKAELLAQPAPRNGELRHMEWEATGFAGVANNTVYLVHDPANSLSAAAKSHVPGNFSGLPCEVVSVRRLESEWYSVHFYTDEAWGERNHLDCTQ